MDWETSDFFFQNNMIIFIHNIINLLFSEEIMKRAFLCILWKTKKNNYWLKCYWQRENILGCC